MKNKTVVFIMLIFSFLLLALFRIASSRDFDRPIVLVHGIGGSAEDMEPMKNELVKMGVPENNIRTIDLSSNKGAITENAQYVGNEIIKISEEFGDKKVMTIGYSMGGEILDFLTKNQEENVTYTHDKAVVKNIDTPLGEIPVGVEIEEITKTIDNMPTHMEDYIDETILIGSGPSDLAQVGYLQSLTDDSKLAYQDLIPDSDFQKKLNSMSPNPKIKVNTISGTDTAFTEEDDDVVSNEDSKRDYAENNYEVKGISHGALNESLKVISLLFNEITNGTLSNTDTRSVLEQEKDQLLLQRSMKQQELAVATKEMPCGALSDKITALQAEINAIDRQIAAIDAQLNSLQ
ncbi:MAG: alpha/beta hydrolase [Candidatus Omnitrophota bacterium]